MTEKIYWWRVKYGYNASDKVTIPESELEKAIYAQIKKAPIQLGDKYINGTNIIVIEPNYHKYTGWYESYEPKEAYDFLQIERDAPDFTGRLEHYKTRVQYLLQSGKTNEIGKNIEIPELSNPIKEISAEVKMLADKFKM